MDATQDDPDRESEIARKDREWAAKAATPAGTPMGTHDPTAEAWASVHQAVGSGAASGAGTYKTPKHLRTTSGPRFSGRGVLAVFGILGILLTVGIMAFLAVKVLDGTSERGGDAERATENLIPDQPGIEPLDSDPTNPGAMAIATECKVERATIETAIEAYELITGRPPSSVEEIIAGGYLRPEDGGFSHKLSSDGTVVPTGECATA